VEVVSIITKDSAKLLNLAEGKTVYAVVKASDVMIAVDWFLLAERLKDEVSASSFIIFSLPKKIYL